MEDFVLHYEKVKPVAERKLSEFSKHKDSEHEALFEEMAFCVFAANSSAKMGLKAVELLKPVLHEGSLEDYRKAVWCKVRFYNKRSEYLYYNREKTSVLGGDLRALMNDAGTHELRKLIVKEFKGFGFKEASHFLRNIGHKGLCIIDKHVLNVMKELGVLKSNKPPRNEEEYLELERKIKRFAEKNNFDVDILDLAIWSYKTGEIIK